jgi:hypothetical protein
MQFHPPAKWVLSVLRAGTALQLRHEPENPYDELAIKVLCKPSAIPEGYHSDLDEALLGTSFDLPSVLAMEEIFLGYVANKVKEGKNNEDVHRACEERRVPIGELSAALAFTMTGKPCVIVGFPEEEGVS